MDRTAFLERVTALHRDGFRLLLVNGTAPKAGPDVPEGSCDVSWSFEKGGALEHLRERLGPGEGVPSIQGIYPFAFLYENELQELFGVPVAGMAVDFHGELYRTAARVPFSAKAIRERLAAKGGKP